MSEERKYTVELTERQAVLVCLVLTQAGLAKVYPNAQSLDFSFAEVSELCEIVHGITLQLLAEED